ncbi:hypothetical protein AT268_17335 [Bacillus cereus]|uniref:Uncharacterized protein n=1 Tax=Bacillus cereus TaxID=1396 RepID=A0A9X0MCI2_BACCE|nr:hypothetical protein [Bacillus cereus]KXY30071.1 hypothetical protein AT268_17335 [Bacillus cereus]
MADVIKIESKDGNIYEVDGKRYRELAKEPEVGDTVLIVNAEDSFGKYEDGDALVIDEVRSRGVKVAACSAIGNIDGFIYNDEFIVVESIEKSIEQEAEQLSRKLIRLEERTEENHRNILTFSQMAESARSDASKAVGGVNALDEQLDLVREDIVFLDEKIDELKESVEERNATPITINIENLNISNTESLKDFIERIAKGRGNGVM